MYEIFIVYKFNLPHLKKKVKSHNPYLEGMDLMRKVTSCIYLQDLPELEKRCNRFYGE